MTPTLRRIHALLVAISAILVALHSTGCGAPGGTAKSPTNALSGKRDGVCDAACRRAASTLEALDRWNGWLSEAQRQEKYCKMASSPFSFYRGSAHLFWRDFANDPRLARFSSDGTVTVLSGDAHTENIGSFDDDHGTLVYELNDFDESVIADYQYDLWRMAISVALVGRQLGYGDGAIADRIDDFVEAYLDRIEEIADNDRENDESYDGRRSVEPVADLLDEIADDNDPQSLLDKWSAKTSGAERRFSASPKLALVDAEGLAAFRAAIVRYGATLDGRLSYDADYFRVKDVAQRLGAGTGSIGFRRYYVLIEGPSDDPDDDVILDVKEQGSPSAWTFLDAGQSLVRSAQLNPAQRVVLAQRALGRRVDDHLGWLNLDGVFFSVRALSPYKSSYPLEKLDDDERFAQLAIQWGAVLATAHARADGDFGGGLLRHNFDRSLFELIDGNHKKFRTLVREIAFEYLERVIGDFENFVAHRGSSCQ
ncbi:MAG: DUF2252 family protein [Myxococcales bacterium]|nr:DUF2252 family protein [Myxococcales bacterium]